MGSKLIDIFNNIFKFNEISVYIAFHDKTREPFFHAKQVCEMMGYNNPNRALQKNADKKNLFFIKDIVKDYKMLYKNVQGNTQFLDEPGLYSIILKSKKEISNDIFMWIVSDVLPSFRKHGGYILNSDLQKQYDELEIAFKQQRDENDVLKHNMKKTKREKGSVIYLLRPVIDTIKFDKDEQMYIKFGSTDNINIRENTYNTGVPNRVQILKTIYVNDSKNIENCVKYKSTNYVVKDKKEYLKCTYNQIIDIIASCVLYYENIEINKQPDHVISRANNVDFDTNKIYTVKILTNFDSDDSDNSNPDSNSNNNPDSNSNSNPDSNSNSNSNSNFNSNPDSNSKKNQSGGKKNIDQKYTKYSLKISRLK